MKYYINCEFEGRGGQLLSMALVNEYGNSMYVVMGYSNVTNEWVRDNVTPHMFSYPIGPLQPYPCILGAEPAQLTGALDLFLLGDPAPHFIADGEQDIMYLCDALVGPTYVPDRVCSGMTFEVKRVNPYPTKLVGAVQHNAWWDAMALRYFLEGANAL